MYHNPTLPFRGIVLWVANAGRGNKNNIRASLAHSIHTYFEAITALSRRSIIFAYVDMYNGSTGIVGIFGLTYNLFYSIRYRGILLLGYLCSTNGSCNNTELYLIYYVGI